MPPHSFIGNWRLISLTIIRNGQTVPDDVFGPAPIGYLMYDGSGHMAVQIMRSDRAASLVPAPPAPVATKSLAVFNGYLAYFGTYTVDDQAATVSHHLEGAISPSDVGRLEVRHYAFAGDTLTLKALPDSADGITVTLCWQRVGTAGAHLSAEM